MELFSPEWFGALLAIIGIDLVLAGDNALVIAMAAKSLPKEQQRRAVFIGTFGAILVRACFAIVAVYLLRIPFVKIVGGLLLFWIGYKLLRSDSGHGAKLDKEATTFTQAISLIIFADAIMGIDNAIAIAGAAKDNIPLVIFGLLLSIPIVMWGSFLILRAIKRFPFIIWLGSALLGYIGGSMVITDPYFAEHLGQSMNVVLLFELVPAAAFLLLGYLLSRRPRAPA